MNIVVNNKEYGLSYEDLKELIEEKTEIISLIPMEILTQELCDLAFELDHKVFEFIPNEFKTQDMCMKAIDYDIDNILYTPHKYLTQELCKKALDYDTSLICCIPDEFITQDAVKKVFYSFPHLLNMLPKEYLTNKEKCDDAFFGARCYCNKSRLERIYEHLPKESRTNNMALSLINEGALYGLPTEEFNHDFCDKAFRYNRSSFKYFPNEYKTYDMCLDAISNPDNMNYIPTHLLDKNICEKYINHMI